jgi:hypothetical protein
LFARRCGRGEGAGFAQGEGGCEQAQAPNGRWPPDPPGDAFSATSRTGELTEGEAKVIAAIAARRSPTRRRASCMPARVATMKVPPTADRGHEQAGDAGMKHRRNHPGSHDEQAHGPEPLR